MPPEARFSFIDDDELAEKRLKAKIKNTTKVNNKSQNCFANYLKSKGMSEEFWLYGEQDLDKILSKFWFDVRTQEGDHYKIASLENLRYRLNRVLHDKGHEFNMVHGPGFKQSRFDFKDACKELKSLWYVMRISYKEIKSKGKYTILM